jgi:hypothetical protein
MMDIDPKQRCVCLVRGAAEWKFSFQESCGEIASAYVTDSLFLFGN